MRLFIKHFMSGFREGFQESISILKFSRGLNEKSLSTFYRLMFKRTFELLYLSFNFKIKSQSNILHFSFLLGFILPVSSRKDFRIDIQDVIDGMIAEKKNSFRITLVVIASFVSVFCHAVYFKVYSFVSSNIGIK